MKPPIISDAPSGIISTAFVQFVAFRIDPREWDEKSTLSEFVDECQAGYWSKHIRQGCSIELSPARMSSGAAQP
jgi:hypothetical protein